VTQGYFAEEMVSKPKREKRSGMSSHHSAAALKDEWLTPPELLKALGSFDCDPCASINRPWPTAAQHFTILDNGLLKEWRGRTWLNPPYGSETGRWLGRLRGHGNGIALIFARTETQDWFEHIWGQADAVLFLRGRLHFYDVTGKRAAANAGAPSALIAYGDFNVDALRKSGLPGRLIIP